MTTRSNSADGPFAAAMKMFDDLRGQFERGVSMRVGRGDVRTAILLLLAEAPRHGYELIAEIERRSNGAWKPSPGSVYPTLQLLTDEALVTARETDGRKVYELTESGGEAAEGASAAPAPWQTGGERQPGDRAALARAGVELAKAAAEVARRGSSDQIAAATTLIDQARAALRDLLTQR